MLINDIIRGLMINIAFIEILFMVISTKKNNDEISKKTKTIKDTYDEIIEEALRMLRERKK